MNRKQLIYIGMAALIIAAAFLYFHFRHTDHAGHDHAEAGKTGTGAALAESAIKEVELNEAQYKAAEITLGTFELKNLSEVINANGYTKLPPQNQADVSAPISGIIKSIKVIEGQYVKAGQTLATLQSLEYNNIRLEKEKLNEALQVANANLEYLNLEYERQRQLSEENVNAKKVFQKVSAELSLEKSKVQTVQSQISILNQTLDVMGSSNSPIIAITAPISGYITDVNIKIGSDAQPGTPLISIVDNSMMHVDLLVYEKDLLRVKPGQIVRFVLTNQDNTEIKGKIFSVGKAFENETKSVAVHADILNDRQMLIPGMYVNALIDIGTNEVKALPVDAIIKADGREFIFVLEEHAEEEHPHAEGEEHVHADKEEHAEGEQHKDEGPMYHFQRIEVKTGTVQLGYAQVTPLQPLDDDAKIVLKGAYYIQSHLLKNEGGGGHEH